MHTHPEGEKPVMGNDLTCSLERWEELMQNHKVSDGRPTMAKFHRNKGVPRHNSYGIPSYEASKNIEGREYICYCHTKGARFKAEWYIRVVFSTPLGIRLTSV